MVIEILSDSELNDATIILGFPIKEYIEKWHRQIRFLLFANNFLCNWNVHKQYIGHKAYWDNVTLKNILLVLYIIIIPPLGYAIDVKFHVKGHAVNPSM